MTGHTKPIYTLLRHNELLISGSGDNTAIVRNIVTATPICVIAGHSNVVKCMALRGAFLYTGSSDTRVMCWDLREAFNGSGNLKMEAMQQLTRPSESTAAGEVPHAANGHARARSGTGSGTGTVVRCARARARHSARGCSPRRERSR